MRNERIIFNNIEELEKTYFPKAYEKKMADFPEENEVLGHCYWVKVSSND